MDDGAVDLGTTGRESGARRVVVLLLSERVLVQDPRTWSICCTYTGRSVGVIKDLAQGQ